MSYLPSHQCIDCARLSAARPALMPASLLSVEATVDQHHGARRPAKDDESGNRAV